MIWVLPCCVLPCCCFARLQGDSSEGARQGHAALGPWSIAAAIQVPNPWMDNGTEKRPASAFLHHA